MSKRGRVTVTVSADHEGTKKGGRAASLNFIDHLTHSSFRWRVFGSARFGRTTPALDADGRCTFRRD